jgi:DNA-3-methyladenine glycosylase I
MIKQRCAWAGSDPIYVRYHDREWGAPLHDDRRLFEFLVLEGAQAGLSWLTILKKRENYRRAFDRFDPEAVASYGAKKIAALLSDAGIVRNRLKISSAVRNARVFLDIRREFGCFDAYLWRFVDGRPKQNRWETLAEIPAETAESRVLSKDLLHRGCTFVGPTICYAFMQAVGMVNDHLVGCFRYEEIARMARRATIEEP